MVTLKQLEAYYWAASLGSFTRAAQRLNVTQSTLSKRIAELELSLGVALFDRSAQRPILTEDGHKILGSAHQMLKIEGEIGGLLKAPSRLSGTCRFGISELTALTWFPDFVARIVAEHPALVLEPYVDLAAALEKRLLRGDLDFAIIAHPPREAGQISAVSLASLDFTWATSTKRIPKSTTLSLDDLQALPIITMTTESRLTGTYERWAKEHHVSPRRVLACNSLSGIIGLTLADVGISFLPKCLVQPLVDSGRLTVHDSKPALPTIEYCFCWRADDVRPFIPALATVACATADFSLKPTFLF